MPSNKWTCRAERPDDSPIVRNINLSAFATAGEADLVDALREDASWIDALSIVATDAHDRPVAHALLTRCHIGGAQALCLAPCAVLPEHQGSGAGSAAIRAVLQAAKELGERFVVVLGHPSYYPRFGFRRASPYGIGLSIEVPDEALMVLTLDEMHEIPGGIVRYAAPFGI